MVGDWSDVSYIQAASFGSVRSRTPIVVIHATDNTASAYGEAGYCSRRTDGTSAHFFVDATSIYQCVPLPNVAHGCLYHGNQISVQFELCGLSDHLTDAVIRKAAAYVRRVCDRYAVPIRKIDAAAVRSAYFNGTSGGICGHADVTAAFPEDNGTHTDPGKSFPWSTFIRYVQGGSVSNIATQTDVVTALADGSTAVGLSDDGHSRPNNIAQVRVDVSGLSTKLDSAISKLDAMAAKLDTLSTGGASAAGGLTAAELAAADRAHADVLDPVT